MSTNKFGHRVIGEKQAAQEEMIQKKRARHFGPRVIGDVFESRERIEKEAEREPKDTFSDPAAREAKKKAAAEEAAKKRAEQQAKEDIQEQVERFEAPVTGNLNELEEALNSNPGFYENLYEAEKARTDPGPRKGALRLFLAFEIDHEDREERKDEIMALLEE